MSRLPVCNLRYADDTVLLAHTEVESEGLLDTVSCLEKLLLEDEHFKDEVYGNFNDGNCEFSI